MEGLKLSWDELQTKYAEDPRRWSGPYEDALLDRLTGLILGGLPEALGRHVGRVMAQVAAYGDHCRWGTAAADTAAFRKAFDAGVEQGLADKEVIPQTWPPREQVMGAFATVAHLADRGPLAHHIDCFEREKHFRPEDLE